MWIYLLNTIHILCVIKFTAERINTRASENFTQFYKHISHQNFY